MTMANRTTLNNNIAGGNLNIDLKRLNTILARNPRDMAAHIQASLIHSQKKDYQKSVHHLKKALACEKNNPVILSKLADELLLAKEPRDALKFGRKLVTVKKRDSNGMFTMAKIYDALSEVSKALQWIEKALNIETQNIEYLELKASLLANSGDMDASVAIHTQILQIDPNHPSSYWPIAQQQKHEGEGARALLEKIDQSIAKNNKDHHLRPLYFAAGKIHQDIGEYDAAFEKFKIGNTLHDIPASADRMIAAYINFRETYSKDLIVEKSQWGDTSFSPIFILGLARSGTTLTESICGAHSSVSAGGELAGMDELNKRLGAYSTVDNGHRNCIEALGQSDITAMAREYVTRYRHLQKDNTRLTDKLPNNFTSIGLIAMLFPNARIIHCRRHPLDNGLSLFSNPMRDFHKEYKSKLEVLGTYFLQYEQIMDFWKQVSPIPIYDVFYEDLVTNTESVARRLIDHLGLEWEDSVMDRSGSQKSVKTLSLWQVRQPVFQTSKGKWRNYEHQLKPLAKVLGSYVDDYEKELAMLDDSSQ